MKTESVALETLSEDPSNPRAHSERNLDAIKASLERFGQQKPIVVDGDGVIGILDFLSLLGAWGTDPGGPPDFDGDGDVGVTDMLALLAGWGPC